MMIYSLTGKIIHTGSDICVIECGGVGYGCKTTFSTLGQISGLDEVTLYTHLAVREDGIELFGFYTKEELECFKLLTSVSGVGARFALAILSSNTPSQVALAIASGDTKAFSKVKGIGNKIAQRVVMELKDKIAKDASLSGSESIISDVASISDGSAKSEAIAALVVLGYTQSEAASAVSRCADGIGADEIIKQCLRLLASGRI